MTETEQKLETFLSDNGICCDSCWYYGKNRPITNTTSDICTNQMNRQTNVYNGQWLKLPETGMCHHWQENVEL